MAGQDTALAQSAPPMAASSQGRGPPQQQALASGQQQVSALPQKKPRQTHIPMQLPTAVQDQGLSSWQSSGQGPVHPMQWQSAGLVHPVNWNSQVQGQAQGLAHLMQGQRPGQVLGSYAQAQQGQVHSQGGPMPVYMQGGQMPVYMQVPPQPQLYVQGQQGHAGLQMAPGLGHMQAPQGPVPMMQSSPYVSGIQGQQCAVPSPVDQLILYFLEKYPCWSNPCRVGDSAAQGYPPNVWCHPH